MISSTNLLGDDLPRSLDEYYRALDDANPDKASAMFAEGILYAVPPSGGIETDPRSVSAGRTALLERFTARGAKPRVHEPLLCTVEGPAAIVEGLTRERSSGQAISSFAASLQLDGDGLISRYLAYECTPAVSPLPSEANPARDSSFVAMDRVDEYFEALDDSRFEDAANCFSSDVLYSHPPYKDPAVAGDGRAGFNGRAELVAAFHRRGPQSIDHRIVFSAQRGPHLLLEGVVEGDDQNLLGTFVSSLTLDEVGLIRRYVAFYCEAGIPRV